MALTQVNPAMLSGSTSTTTTIQSNNTAAITIDASQNVTLNGRVTMPYQPAFYAYRTSFFNTPNTVFIWDATKLNRGSYYSTSTGRFTAPVAGAYAFFVTMLPNSTSSSAFYYIRKNATQWGATTYTINPDETVSYSAIVDMAANDYVDVFVIADGSEANYTSFSGNLIG